MSCIDLIAQHLAGRNSDRLLGVWLEQVAQHECGFWNPWQHPHCCPVGHRHHVAITAVIARKPIARHRIVIHVSGDQIVAVFRSVIGHIFKEKPAGHAFADKPTLKIGKPNDDRIDIALLDQRCQLVTCKRATRHELDYFSSSSRSIAMSSSFVPCTFGPVNHLLADSFQYSHTPMPNKTINGPVKFMLFW